jgi:hypothetical protein
LQAALSVTTIIADQGTGDNRFLPAVLVVDLRHGNIKFAVQAMEEGFQPASFLFQRCASGQVQMDG